ncbi:MAG TPA: cyclic nucleotide-binding domain-containing protein, partial [bacterium]|nr:cyclic nucleotide-binding domain-containing protein [bacterium]
DCRMPDREDILESMASLALFADLSRPELEAAAHTFEEEWFTEGQRILRQGFTGSNFYIILDGEAAVRIDGETRATLGRGEFFGEVSVLLGGPPIADVVALRPLRCIALSDLDLEAFLTKHPRVTFRMLQAMARRLQSATRWRS